MYDFETLVADLLQKRPELTREELTKRIEEKKNTVGAGYLTDQGALFLVAGELGVSLRNDEISSDLTIKDLYIGANDVTVVARVLGAYPTATYNRKEGGTGKYRRIALFDGKESVRLTIWEERLEEVDKLGLAVGSLVRVVSGYVKQGLDGKPTLNLGRKGRIEIVSDEKIESKVPALSASVEKLPKLTHERQFVAVECVVNSEPRYSEFVRSDGSEGSLFQFGVTGVGGAGEIRVVIWSPSAQPELKVRQRVLITNLRVKRSSNGEMELHGDAASTIVMDRKPEAMQLRVAAPNSGTQVKVILALDRSRKVKIVELGDGVQEPILGQVIGVVPDSESDGRAYCKTPDSLKIVDEDSFPSLEELVTKIKDVKEDETQLMVEVIALSHGTVEEVRLKDGSMVKKGELVIGDDTGETRLVGWRDLSERLSGIQPGERLRVVGATIKPTKLGGHLLQVSNITAIEKLKGRS